MKTPKQEFVNIYRFYRDTNRPKRLIQTHVLLEKAQEHCSDPKTRKEGVYFDGYSKE